MSGESDRDKALSILSSLYQFAKSESKIAVLQSAEAKTAKDYRAADRHSSYGLAMAKVAAKCSMHARHAFTVDLEKLA